MPPKRKPSLMTRRSSSDGDFRPPTSYPPSPQVEKRRPKRHATLGNISAATRPSRLQPSQPLHMTTRRAASKAATNSTADSVGSTESRRSSLGDTTRVAGGVDIDADRPTKKVRLSDRSSTTTGTTSAVQHAQSRSPDPVKSNQDASIPDIITTVEPPRIQEPQDATLPTEGSVANARQDDGESDVQQRLSPLPKRRGRGRPKVKRALTPTGSIAESFIPGTPMNGDGLEVGTDREAPKATRRLPGRRRAPNADPLMEACLRRQLQLRIGHRAVSKALKPVLIELARRTAAKLEQHDDDQEFLEVERTLKAELQRRLDERIQIIENERRIRTEYYLQRLKWDEDELAIRYKDRVRALEEDYDLRLEHRILQLGRQYEHEKDDDATDDENGDVVHPLHTKPTARNPTGRLDERFDSRSRFFLETESLVKSREFRKGFGRQQEDAILADTKIKSDDEDEAIRISLDELPESFGSFDHPRREQAITALSIHTLVRASSEVERRVLHKQQPEPQQSPSLSNSEAPGLQALADAIEIDQNSRATAEPATAKALQYQPPPPLTVGASTQNYSTQDSTNQIYHNHQAPHESPRQHEEPHTPKRVNPYSPYYQKPSQTANTEVGQSTSVAHSPTITYQQHQPHTRATSDSAIMDSPRTPAELQQDRHGYSVSVPTTEHLYLDRNSGQVMEIRSPPARNLELSMDLYPMRATKDSEAPSTVAGAERVAHRVYVPAVYGEDRHPGSMSSASDVATSRPPSEAGPVIVGPGVMANRGNSHIGGTGAGPAAGPALAGPSVTPGGGYYQLPPPPPQQQPQQRGVFFGPPPPPQFGRGGPQQQPPWHR